MTVWFMLKRLRQVSKEENEIVLNGIVQADETFIGPSTDRNRRLQVKRRIHEEEQEMLHGPTDSKRRRKGIKQKAGRKKGSTKEVLAQKKEERGGEEYKTHTPSVRIPFETGAMVLGMMEKGGKVVMKKIGTDKRSVSSRIIFPVLTRHIDQDSILITDQAGAYKGTHEIFKQHLTVVHGTKFVSPDGIHDNDLENAWKHLKKMIRGTYIHTSFHHLDGYLNEFAYRWNKRKQTEKELFEAFIPMVVDKRVTLKELKAKGKE